MILSKQLAVAGLILSLIYAPSMAFAQRDDSTMTDFTRRYNADTNRKAYQDLIGQARKVAKVNPAEAEAFLLKALALKSEFIVPMYAQTELATLYLSQKKNRAAIKVYDALFKDSLQWGGSEEPKILADYADALMSVGEIKRAIAPLNAAVKSINATYQSSPKVPVFDEEAIPTVQEIRATIHLVRGIHYHGSYQLAEAGKELVNATRFAPQSDLGHYYLGAYYERVHKDAEAIAEYEKVGRSGDGHIRRLADERRASISLP